LHSHSQHAVKSAPACERIRADYVGFMAFVTGRSSNTATDGQRSTWMATAERPKRPTATRKTDFVSLCFVASFSRRIIAQAKQIIHAFSLRPK
jgi:hypothetical protein